MSDPTKLQVVVSAKDDTKKGFSAATKDAKRFSKDVQEAGRQGRTGFVRHVSAMEKAAAETFGHRSMSGALGQRFSAVRQAQASFSSVRAEQQGFGQMLGLATTGLGLLAGAAVAAAGAAFSFVNGWAKSGADLARLSQSSGIAADKLAAIGAVGERNGLTRDQAQGTAAGFAGRLNDALYGRDNTMLARLNQLGVNIARDRDGNVDTEATIQAIGEALKNAKGSDISKAQFSGDIGLGAFWPMLRKGGAAWAASMADAKANAPAWSPDEAEQGQRIQEKETRVKQRAERWANRAEAGGAGALEGGADAALAITDPRQGAKVLARAEDTFKHVLDDTVHAVQQVAHALDGGAHIVAGGFEKAEHAVVEGSDRLRKAFGSAVADAFAYFRSQGLSHAQAAGLTASLHGESKLRPDAVGDGGKAFGIGQWHPDRQARFQAWAGHDIRHSTLKEQRAFVLFEHATSERRAGKALDAAQTPRAAAEAEVDHYERPKDRAGEKRKRGDLAEKIAAAAQPQKVAVDITLKGAPAGTVTSVRGGPAISVNVARSMPHLASPLADY